LLLWTHCYMVRRQNFNIAVGQAVARSSGWTATALGLLSAGISATTATTAWAQDSSEAAASANQLSAVTVTATRIAEPDYFVPAAIDSAPIAPDALGVNASESLQYVPGLIVRDRQNYAQDEQISIRGFGARAPFNIAGIRIYMDGIPASQPDGQGTVTQFDLASAERIEVLRGPFSVLYGNSAGGVLQLFTANGSGPLRATGGLVYGSFDQRRVSADVEGGDAAFNYNVGASYFATDGSRGHSAAERSSLNGKWGFDFDGAGKLTLLLNLFDGPDAEDPLGLTRAQFNANPQGTAPSAAEFNTRKSADQGQLGAVYELPVNEHNTVTLTTYGGHRDVLQFQAIPVGTQKAVTSPGGVVSLSNDYGGVEPRWTYHTELLGAPYNVTAGLNYDDLDEHREGYDNFIGTALGVQGALRRNELDDVHDLDQYLQTQLGPIDRWTVFAGLRRSRVYFQSVALFVPPPVKSGNGGVDYGATSPVGGILFQVDQHLNLYTSYGQGFETPTLDELAYRPSGEPGLNLSLLAARSRSYEGGAKLRFQDASGADLLNAELALFRSDLSNELILASNTGGRSIYGNAGLTRHQGIEFETLAQLTPTLQFHLAYTYLDALVETSYLSCSSVPCPRPNTFVAAGNRIPGLPPNDLFTGLQWQPLPNWSWTFTDSYVAAFFADDANRNYAGAYNLLGLITDYAWSLDAGTLHGFLRLDNLLNRVYAGSVIVNNTSAEYYEAGPGRAVLVGVNFQMR
jgi:iron complex outermembrane recepter protein